jgi:cysteine desulfurase
MSFSELYFDHNATSIILPEVAAAMAECYAAGYTNPASQHQSGQRARQRIDRAREAIGRLLGAEVEGLHPDRVIFTSGGTEANNLAIHGLAANAPGNLAISAIEHPSITLAARKRAQQGATLSILPVSPQGMVDVDHCQALLTNNAVRLLSLMLANNETGVLQPVADIAPLCAAQGVAIHTDAAQVVGKLPVDFRALGVDAMTVAAHKFHGPVGIGALVVRSGVELDPQLAGGFQQNGLRPGTEPVALVVGMQVALECWYRERAARFTHMQSLRDRFETALQSACPDLVIHGQEVPRLPTTSNIAFAGINRQAMFVALDLAGVACSTGSACSSGSSEPSPTLLAMGCPKEVVESSLRFSLGCRTIAAEVDEAVCRILRVYNDLRSKTSPRKMPAMGRGPGQVSL